jgi:hypothetical protein
VKKDPRSSNVKPPLRLVGRVSLSPRQLRIWRSLVGCAPSGVTTSAQLLDWVNTRKALVQSRAAHDDPQDQFAALDALFEWATGEAVPDVPARLSPARRPAKSTGLLMCHVGSRGALERELLVLILNGRGNTAHARALRVALERRSSLRSV